MDAEVLLRLLPAIILSRFTVASSAMADMPINAEITRTASRTNPLLGAGLYIDDHISTWDRGERRD